MKREPKAVYIKKNNNYEELSYDEFINSGQAQSGKRFLFLHGVLMEVDEDTYKDYYKVRRRQKYLLEQSVKNGDISYDMLTTDECNGENLLIDCKANVEEQVADKFMKEKLKHIFPLLPEDERTLIFRYFFEEKSQDELSCIYGVGQSNISRRITKILEKIKNLKILMTSESIA